MGDTDFLSAEENGQHLDYNGLLEDTDVTPTATILSFKDHQDNPAAKEPHVHDGFESDSRILHHLSQQKKSEYMHNDPTVGQLFLSAYAYGNMPGIAPLPKHNAGSLW